MKKETKYTDPELTRGILAGENETLHYLYKTYFQSIRHFIIMNSGQDEDADDVFQEALIVLYRKLRDNTLELRCSLKTYIYSVAKIIWLNELSGRKKKDTEITEPDDFKVSDDDIIRQVHKNERLKLFRKHFEMLSSDCKKVIRLVLNNVSISEITKIMGYGSEQHTKNRRYRCKKSLIERIRNCNEYEELRFENNRDDREIPRW